MSESEKEGESGYRHTMGKLLLLFLQMVMLLKCLLMCHYMHRSASLKCHHRSFFKSRWRLTQRPTSGQGTENKSYGIFVYERYIYMIISPSQVQWWLQTEKQEDSKIIGSS